MSSWNIIVIICGLLLLIFICRKEFIRANKARLRWRILASVFAIVCLVCMGLPVTFRQSALLSDSVAIVITEGANEDSVQQFNKNQKLVIYHSDDLLSTEHPKYDSLHVFGYGFSADELAMLGNTKLISHPSTITNGIAAIDWNRRIEKAKGLLVQGIYKNYAAFPVTLILSGFNTILDSVTVPAKQEQVFQLRTVPKQNGKAVYSLLALHQKDTLEKEPIPIEVVTAASIKVLMLAASPDFENRFLKDWLSQNGYTVVSKTAISTNKFNKTFLNTASVSLDRVTPGLLDSFDVLLSDETALLSLSKPEQENIHSQVTRKGMGMIIRSDTINPSKEWFNRPFQLYASQGKPPSHLSIHIMNDETANAVLSTEQPLFIRYRNGMQPLVKDSTNNIVAGIIAEGAGKIVFTTLDNTYNWILAGNGANYYSLWSGLLQKTARQEVAETWVETSVSLPVQQQPICIISGTKNNTLPVLEIDGNKIAVAQNEHIADRWQGVYWPTKAGWQNSVNVQGMSNNWYVYDQQDWKYVAAQKKITATRQYSRNIDKSIKNEWIAGKPLPVPVPLLYFFLPFIICCGFLWMERKIF